MGFGVENPSRAFFQGPKTHPERPGLRSGRGPRLLALSTRTLLLEWRGLRFGLGFRVWGEESFPCVFRGPQNAPRALQLRSLRSGRGPRLLALLSTRILLLEWRGFGFGLGFRVEGVGSFPCVFRGRQNAPRALRPSRPTQPPDSRPHQSSAPGMEVRGLRISGSGCRV